MSEVVTKSYVGIGRVWVRPFGVTVPSVPARRHVGNVSGLVLRHTLDIQRQPDFTRPGGGTAIRRGRVQAVEASMTWLHFSPENWAVAMAATLHDVAAGTGVVEVVKAHRGSISELANLPTSITSVTDGATPTPVTFTAGDDYELSAAGVYIPTGSAIPDGSDITVTYSHAAQKRLEGSMGTATVLDVLFEGLNDADTQKPVVLNLWRMSVPPAEELNLIGLELGEMQLSAELLKDPSKGANVSAFYRARMLP